MADLERTDTPRGPGRDDGADPPDAPPLGREQAGRPAGGDETGNEPAGGGAAAEPQPGERAAEQGVDPTSAEAVIPDLRTDWRIVKGSDPDELVAGLRAAAAADPGAIDERSYAAFVASHTEPWPSVADLVRAYGSFAAALRAAGIVEDSAARGI
jgi:hypothetical protein